ncbi:DUF4304 domain-containing protein [Sphingobacterium sp. Mn56C]|uniref:DUF4304 domain-containing protein n=1 Tax=Sphingobacterium sp. Mn56C TaxID=3395261 RepID=UPI003BD77B7F
MDSKEFKKLFGEVAKSNGFESAFGGWFKDSAESIVVLELQKSSFANSNYLNVKVFIQGAFDRTYTPNKDLIKSSMGHITNQIRDKEILDFDEPMDDDKRKGKLGQLFSEFIVPFAEKALSKSGIKELADKGEIILLPAVKEELA